MGQNKKKSDFIFGNVSNIHSKVIFPCRGHISIPNFMSFSAVSAILGLFEVENGQKV